MGIRAIERLLIGILDWHFKMGMGCYIEGDRAFLFIANPKHVKPPHLPPKRYRVILVRKKIALRK